MSDGKVSCTHSSQRLPPCTNFTRGLGNLCSRAARICHTATDYYVFQSDRSTLGSHASCTIESLSVSGHFSGGGVAADSRCLHAGVSRPNSQLLSIMYPDLLFKALGCVVIHVLLRGTRVSTLRGLGLV